MIFWVDAILYAWLYESMLAVETEGCIIRKVFDLSRYFS